MQRRKTQRREVRKMTRTKKTAEEILMENGCEGAVYLTDYDYATAIIGKTFDGRIIYDYEKMVEWLIIEGHYNNYDDAAEWVDYNTLRALPYMGEKAPIVIQQV